MAGTAPPEEGCPQVPKYVRLPPDILPAHERSPKVVFPGLGKQSECVWISHENIVPGL